MNSYLLLPAELAEQPESNRTFVRSIVAAYQLLWHPELLAKANQLPALRAASDPLIGEAFVVCTKDLWDSLTPPQRVDWMERTPPLQQIDVKQVDAEGLKQLATSLGLRDSNKDADFFALGFAYLSMEVLFRGMGQANPLDAASFFEEVQRAAEACVAKEEETARDSLQAAFEALLSARQMVYPATINIVDLALANDSLEKSSLESRPTHLPINLIIAGKTLEDLAEQNPDVTETLKDAVLASHIEILTGSYLQRPFATLPFESRCFEVAKCSSSVRRHLGDISWQFGSRTQLLSPSLPMLIAKHNIRHAVHSNFDGGRYPHFRDPNIQWASLDGSSLESLCRSAIDAFDDSQALQLSVALAKTVMTDRSATLVLAHWVDRHSVWYDWLLRIHSHITLFGQFETLGDFFINAMMADSSTMTYASEYSSRALARAVEQQAGDPISRHVNFVRARAAWDVQSTLTSIAAMLGASPAISASIDEDSVEQGIQSDSFALETESRAQAESIASVVMRGASGRSGHLAFNPCASARRAGIIVDGVVSTSLVGGPVRQVQETSEGTAIVVDVPGFGFAWIPTGTVAEIDSGAEDPGKLRTQSLAPAQASGKRIRNEYVELEIDPATGGIRGIWALPGGYTRLAQQLVRTSGGTSVCDKFEVTAAGPAFAEIVSTGRIVEAEIVYANFTQRTRLWAGTPIIEISIRLDVNSGVVSANLKDDSIACRWAWPDDKSAVVTADGYWMLPNGGEDLETPTILEIRERNIVTQILTDGLCFHRRSAARQADTLLHVPGETAKEFQLRIGIDLKHPMFAGQLGVRPLAVVPVSAGPPKIGRTGWFINLSPNNILCSQLRSMPAEEGVRLQIHLVETANAPSNARIRFAKTPSAARLVNGAGDLVYSLAIEDDAVLVDLSALEYVIAEVEF